MTTPVPPPYGGYQPPPYDPYGRPGPRPTNGMAIASLVCAFIFAPLGIVFGHISLSQIRRTGEEGHGLAVAGLVISYLVTVGTVIVMSVVVLFTIAVARHLDDESGYRAGITAAPTTPSGG